MLNHARYAREARPMSPKCRASCQGDGPSLRFCTMCLIDDCFVRSSMGQSPCDLAAVEGRKVQNPPHERTRCFCNLIISIMVPSAGSTIACIFRLYVSSSGSAQGLPRLYGAMVTRKPGPFSPVYRTHDKRGLCAASASKSPPFLINSSQASGMCALPDCMHAGW